MAKRRRDRSRDSRLTKRPQERSAHELQRDLRNAGGDVEADLSLNRERLQRDRAIVAADQQVCSKARAYGRLRGGTRIGSGEPAAPTCRRYQPLPRQLSSSGEADIEADFGDGANILLR